MVPVAGHPILHYILTWLAEQGVSLVGINLHYKPEAIEQFVGDGSRYGLEVRYTREPELLGSAGALRQLLPLIGDGDGPVIAVYGDTLATLPLGPLLDWHATSRAVLTMAVMEHPNPTEAGIVDLGERRPWAGSVAGGIRRILEKPAPHEVFSTIANAGVFAIDRGVEPLIAASGPMDIARELIPTLLREGLLVSGWLTPPDAVLWDVGTWASLERAGREWPAAWARRPRV